MVGSSDPHLLIPRGPTLDSNSPVILRQKRALKTQSLFLPHSKFPGQVTPRLDLDKPEEMMTLLDFLDENTQRPNRVSPGRGGEERERERERCQGCLFMSFTPLNPAQRKHMEIKRASMISTPPVTPRNSVMMAVNQSHGSDQMELQSFLAEYQMPDTMSIPEVEETESDQHYQEEGGGPKLVTPHGSFSSGTTTPEEIPHNWNSNSNNNSPSLPRIAASGEDKLRRGLRVHEDSLEGPPRDSSSPVAMSTDAPRPLRTFSRRLVPTKTGDEGGIPKSRSADDMLRDSPAGNSKAAATAETKKQHRRSFFRSSLGDLTSSRSKQSDKKAHKSSEDLTERGSKPEEPSRERTLSLFSSTRRPESQTRSRNKSKRLSFSGWRRRPQPVNAEASLPTVPEDTSIHNHLSQGEMMAYAFDNLSQPQLLSPDSLTCPADSSHWNEYGFVQ